MKKQVIFAAGFWFCFTVLALAQDKPERKAEEPVTPEAVLDSAAARWETIKDYQCVMRSYNRKGEKEDDKNIKFLFKRNHQIRMEVIAGPNKGGVVVRSDRGVIKGWKKGLFSFISATLEDNDKRLLNLRGRKFYHTDWGTLIGEARERARSGWTLSLKGEEKVKGTPCHLIELVREPDPDAGGGAGEDGEGEDGSKEKAPPRVTRDLLWIGKKDRLVLQRKQYEGEVLVNEVTWWDIKVNAGIGDELFDS